MRLDRVTPEVVELAPPVLEHGRLYISPKFKAVVHLCCCGCGEKVVTPLSPAEWRVELNGDRATLFPSIGNWSMPCQSHYWIRDNQVIWGTKLSKRQVAAVFERDHRDLRALHHAAKSDVGDSSRSPSPDCTVKRTGAGWLEALKRWLSR
jgi:hypothetical protein